jgi:oxygen-dependent protoporphyrinogen oxidase
LVQTLANNLAGGISLNTYIKTISPNPWTMETSQGTVTAKNVVFTLPTYESAELIRPLSAEAAEALREIPYAPIKVIHLGFKRTDISHRLKGFGYLVVPSEKKNILGCLWSSSLFSDRAPEGHVLLTVFMGGMTNPVMATKTNEDLLQFALLDLGPMLGVREAPHFYSVTSYEKAIPQYTRGHSERLEKLTAMEKKYSGLYFAGNYRAGISVSDVVQHAMEMALQLQKSARD